MCAYQVGVGCVGENPLGSGEANKLRQEHAKRQKQNRRSAWDTGSCLGALRGPAHLVLSLESVVGVGTRCECAILRIVHRRQHQSSHTNGVTMPSLEESVLKQVRRLSKVGDQVSTAR